MFVIVIYMITALIGLVTSISDTSITLQVASLFIDVIVANPKRYILQETVTIKTYLHWNPEQGFSLFGFHYENEKTIFLELLQCGGVGPRLALSIIGHFSVSELLEITQKGNLQALTTIPGIGQKKGEQILLYMKHALKRLEHLYVETDLTSALNRHITDVEKTLLTLQYKKSEIQQAIRHIYQDRPNIAQNSETFDQLLRTALKFLSTAGR